MDARRIIVNLECPSQRSGAGSSQPERLAKIARSSVIGARLMWARDENDCRELRHPLADPDGLSNL